MAAPMTRQAAPHATGAYHAVHLTPHAAHAVVWQAIAAHLARWVPADAAVIEIGAGYCGWVNAVRAGRRVAVDAWPELPRHAAPGVQPVVLDLGGHGLRALGDAAFDVALASNVLEHFEPDGASVLVADLAALLRPGGRLLVIQPNFRYAYRRYFDDFTHRSIFTDVSLAALLRTHGFHIEASAPRFLPYSMRDGRWPVARWAVRAYLRSPIKPWAGQMLIVARKP
jgi:SAM-dependent methyltransferase